MEWVRLFYGCSAKNDDSTLLKTYVQESFVQEGPIEMKESSGYGNNIELVTTTSNQDNPNTTYVTGSFVAVLGEKIFCCPALELFHCLPQLFCCLPQWTTVRLHGKKLQNSTNISEGQKVVKFLF